MANSVAVAEFLQPYVKNVHMVPLRRGKLANLAQFLRSLMNLENAYDVVILFNLRLLPLALLARGSRPHLRIVADLHDAPRGLDRLLSRAFLKFTNGSIAISRFVANHLGIHNAIIIPRPISDDAKLSVNVKKRSDSGDVILGIVGRIDPEKRIEVAIDAMRYLPDRFRLHVYGQPCLAEESYMKALKLRAQADDRITFRGFMAADDIYEELDAIVVCNEREPSGRTVGEAMVKEKVVFAPDRGGAREFFDESLSGFIYKALDAADLARAICCAFESGAELELLRRRASEKIIRERSPKAIASVYFRTLDRIAST